jgi:hypothetical protein
MGEVASVVLMVVRSWRLLAAAVACVACVACSDVQHVVGKADLSASGGSGSIAGNAGVASGGQGGQAGRGGGAPIAGAGMSSFDASLPDAVPACAVNAVLAERRRLDIYLVLDTNITIAVDGAWPIITEGIKRYARLSAAEGTGLGYDMVGPELTYLDPTNNICNSRDYQMPFVVIGREPLPANADAVEQGLENTVSVLDVPLAHVLEGALTYVGSIRDSYRTKPVIVLVTDGFPDFACGSTIARVAEVAEVGAANELATYVIEVPIINGFVEGIVDEFVEIVLPPATLTPVASASGTTLRMLTPRDDADAVARMLLAIQREAEPCDYALPEGMAWEDIQLAVDDGTAPHPLQRLSSLDECSGSSGVYLDPKSGFARACLDACKLIRGSGRPPLWVRDCTTN